MVCKFLVQKVDLVAAIDEALLTNMWDTIVVDLQTAERVWMVSSAGAVLQRGKLWKRTCAERFLKTHPCTCARS